MMKKHRLLGNVVIGLLLTMAFTACNDTEDTFEVNADAIFFKKKIDGVEMMATGYYAYANKSLTSASVETPDGETIDLEAYPGSSYTFYSEPADEDYSETYPEEGAYYFTMTAKNGDVLEIEEDQEYYDMGFAEIDSMGFDTDYYWLYFNWDAVTGADAYAVRLLDSSGELVYVAGIDSDTNEAYISNYYNTGTWYSSPVEDETYTLVLQTNRYDDDLDDSNYAAYNIQEITYSSYEITWDL